MEQFANIMDHKAKSCIILANFHHYTLTSYLPVKNKQQNYESILLASEKQTAKLWKHLTCQWKTNSKTMKASYLPVKNQKQSNESIFTQQHEKQRKRKLAYCDILCCVTFWLTDVGVLWYPVLLCHILADITICPELNHTFLSFKCL